MDKEAQIAELMRYVRNLGCECGDYGAGCRRRKACAERCAHIEAAARRLAEPTADERNEREAVNEADVALQEAGLLREGERFAKAIPRLIRRLAATPAQQPVAFAYQSALDRLKDYNHTVAALYAMGDESTVPLYASPVSAPQGADEAHTDHPMRHWDRTCPACISQGADEPVLWGLQKPDGSVDPDLVGSKADCEFWARAENEAISGWAIVPLYTAPLAADVQPDNDCVICPACAHQFRAIPVNVQGLLLSAGFEPPFTADVQGMPEEEQPK